MAVVTEVVKIFYENIWMSWTREYFFLRFGVRWELAKKVCVKWPSLIWVSASEVLGQLSFYIDFRFPISCIIVTLYGYEHR